MFSALHRLKIKITLILYAIIAILLLLLAFALYVNIRGVQSVDYIQHQASSTSDISVLMERVAVGLEDISGELQGLRRETCLARGSQNC